MSKTKCRFCGGQLEHISDGFICRDCGKRADLTENMVTENENEPLGVVEKKANRKKQFIIIACILVIFGGVIFGIISFSGNEITPFTDNKIQRIIEKNGFEDSIDTETVEEISKIELEPDVSGLSSGYSLVLLGSENDDKYTLALIDYSNEQMQIFDYGGYFPLEIIVDEYLTPLPREQQVEHLECLAGYINEYGVNCFESRDVAEAYIKETGKFYSVADARASIEMSALYRLPNSKDISDFKVVFAGESAVPLYYAFMTKSIERNPFWGYIDINSLNAIQIDFFLRQFGPINIEKEIWHAYNRDFNLMDYSFKSSTYADLEKALLEVHKELYGSIN